MPFPALPRFGIIDDPIEDSPFASNNNPGNTSPTPPTGNNLLLLNGSPFLLLNGNNFQLLG